MKKSLVFMFIAILCAALTAQPAAAGGGGLDRYVATTGLNIGDCTTSTSPCNTITYAIGQAGNGDVIHIAAGTYFEDLFVNESLTLVGAGMNQTIVDAGGSGRPFYMWGGVFVSLSDITFQNGYIDYCCGGGIDNNGGTLTLTRVKVTNNTADDGGGVAISSGNGLTMVDSYVTGNHANIGPLSNGGGMYLESSAAVVFNLRRVTISGNLTEEHGGGIYLTGDGTLNLENVTLSGNVAEGGGAIYTVSSSVTNVLNSTISQNTSTGFADNVENFGVINFRSTIINGDATNNCDNFGTQNSLGYNLENGNTCEFDQGTDIIDTDPLLKSLGQNGGYTPTHALSSDSPAVDTGDDGSCPAVDQRGYPRPQDGDNNGTANCDIGAYEYLPIKNFRSAGKNDGWLLEKSETSGTGGSMDSTATTFRLGDNAANKQYRAILHFNTAGLPDDAVITRVTLKIKRNGLVGTDPFITHQYIVFDMREGSFSNNAILQLNDFKAAASKSSAGSIQNTPVSNWYSSILSSTANSYINLSGVTQFRLRFKTDDDNDAIADYIKFYSGNHATASYRPWLQVEYYVP